MRGTTEKAEFGRMEKVLGAWGCAGGAEGRSLTPCGPVAPGHEWMPCKFPAGFISVPQSTSIGTSSQFPV